MKAVTVGVPTTGVAWTTGTLTNCMPYGQMVGPVVGVVTVVGVYVVGVVVTVVGVYVVGVVTVTGVAVVASINKTKSVIRLHSKIKRLIRSLI